MDIPKTLFLLLLFLLFLLLHLLHLLPLLLLHIANRSNMQLLRPKSVQRGVSDFVLESEENDPAKSTRHGRCCGEHSQQVMIGRVVRKVRSGRLLPPTVPFEIGVDGVGTGSVVGPITFAAVYFPHDTHIPGLDDSKKMTANARRKVAEVIKDRALSFSVQNVSAREIDESGLSWAIQTCIVRAVDAVLASSRADVSDGDAWCIRIDGKPWAGTREMCERVRWLTAAQFVVRGDGQFTSMAAASVLAKVHRDDVLMPALHQKFPEYNWIQNKGYYTAEHRNAVRIHGLCPHHRKSFSTQQHEQLKKGVV
eukprot:ANDGO_03567.mRNA.1 Ribonuclease HII